MLKRKAILGVSLALLCASCGTNYEYNYNDYKFEITADVSKGFKILQLNDVHYGSSTDLKREFKYLDSLVNHVSPDLMVFCGDLFMDATKNTVREALAHFETYKIPYSIVFGNHDRQGFYSPQFLLDEIKNAGENVMFKNFDDNVYGDSNYFINIIDKNSLDIKWQIYLIDSNSYHYQAPLDYEYDVIHEDQIDWYKKCVNKTTELNKNVVVPSVCFFHIPLWEFEEPYQQYGDDFNNEVGYVAEKVSKGYKNTGFFETAKSLGSTKGIFCAHDHVNSFDYKKDGIILSYGVKTGECLYHTDDKIGGQVVTLKIDGSVTVERIYQGY